MMQKNLEVDVLGLKLQKNELMYPNPRCEIEMFKLIIHIRHHTTITKSGKTTVFPILLVPSIF
jgi:hypothetical protein